MYTQMGYTYIIVITAAIDSEIFSGTVRKKHACLRYIISSLIHYNSQRGYKKNIRNLQLN